MTIRHLALGTLAIALALPAHAQFGDLLNRAQQKANQVVDKAVDKAVNDAMSGKPAAPPTPSAAPAASPTPPAAGTGEAAATPPATPSPARGAASQATSAQAVPEVYGNDFDFIPGELLLFFDDFADTEVGDFPARWRLLGGNNGQAEVVDAKGARWFKQRLPEEGGRQSGTHALMRYQVKGDLPQKFTVEFDVMAGEGTDYGLIANSSRFLSLSGQEFRSAHGLVNRPPAWKAVQVKHVAIAVNGTSLKLYLDGKRVFNDPEAVPRPIKDFGVRLGSMDETRNDGVMITNFRVGEGGKDITPAILTEGRIVTHGITFDTGSDRIRPESGPTLRKILKLLQDDEALAFEIQGHTDDQGGAKVNGPLSERRATAVRAWLVAQGIDGGRLTTKGLGATKPIRPNDTADGRAENRRVEFVKRGT